MNNFIVEKVKPPPPITKAGLKEYVLELVIDGDLVSLLSLSMLV